MNYRPFHVDAAQWQNAFNKARIICDEIARNGGSARDATRTYGLGSACVPVNSWELAVQYIATDLCGKNK